MLYVIHLTETDGDIHYECLFTIQEAKEYIQAQGLVKGDYKIIQGTIIDHY